ncbi:spore coat protein CotH [Serratia marcescens]|nr:spore coat protein CotH [Serratia marcescens]
MNHNLLFSVLLILTPLSVLAGEYGKVSLIEGVNMLDVNGDGVKDIVIYAKFDNNTSHPNNTMTIFIKNNKKYNIVPVPNDAGFTWFDFSLSASTTKIIDYQLYKKNNGYFVVSAYKLASKQYGEDVSDELPVKFSRYDIKINNESPGVSLFYWDITKTYVSKERYSDTDKAFNNLNIEVLK